MTEEAVTEEAVTEEAGWLKKLLKKLLKQLRLPPMAISRTRLPASSSGMSPKCARSCSKTSV